MGKLNLSNQPLKGRKNKFGYALKTIKVCGYSCCLIRRGERISIIIMAWEKPMSGTQQAHGLFIKAF